MAKYQTSLNEYQGFTKITRKQVVVENIYGLLEQTCDLNFQRIVNFLRRVEAGLRIQLRRK